MDFSTITSALPAHVIVTQCPSYTRFQDDRGKILIIKGKRIEFSNPLKELEKKVRGMVELQAEEIKRRHLGPIKATGYIKDVPQVASIMKVYFRRK